MIGLCLRQLWLFYPPPFARRLRLSLLGLRTASSDFGDLIFGKRFDANECVSSGTNPDQLIELGLNSGSVSVLRILNNKNHQEGNDSGASIDDQLPGI